jgi:predicted RNA binding protein YcfA (HicA-like mRNA interferase family)
MDIAKEVARLRRGAGNVRQRDVRALLEAAGWTGRKRKHCVYTKPGRYPIIVPDHPGALKVGTVHDILDGIEDDLADG